MQQNGILKMYLMSSDAREDRQIRSLEAYLNALKLPNTTYQFHASEWVGSNRSIKTVIPVPRMVAFKAGTYTDYTDPDFVIRIEHPFELGMIDVTQGLFEDAMGYNPSQSSALVNDKSYSRRLPVTDVSWYGAIAFCNRLSLLHGLESYYRIVPNTSGGASHDSDRSTKTPTGDDTIEINNEANGYRLPTISEWIYGFASVGHRQYMHEPFRIIGWNTHNSNRVLQPVAQLKPNASGLYDMLGNSIQIVAADSHNELILSVGLAYWQYENDQERVFDDIIKMSKNPYKYSLSKRERCGHMGFRLARSIR